MTWYMWRAFVRRLLGGRPTIRRRAALSRDRAELEERAVPATVAMVADINPGTTGNYPNSSSPSGMVVFKGKTYFAANDGTHGQELWRTDGTTAGTVMVADLFPGSNNYGPNSSGPRSFTVVGSKLYFTANNGTGQELWRTDGTAAGTVLVKDIFPGTYTRYGRVYPNSSYPAGLVSYKGKLYFAATDGNGRELWAVSQPTV
jgi:ELWxxDGT repeat protein